MTLVLSEVMLAHTRQLRDEAPLIWLYELQVVRASPVKRFRLTNFDRIIPYGTDSAGEPVLYYPAPIAHGDLRVSKQGDIPQFQMQVGTATLEMMQWLEDYDGLIGGDAVVRLVSSADLLNPNANLSFYGQVTGCSVDPERTALTIGPQNLVGVKAPPQRFSKFHCRHRYGSAACGADLTNEDFFALFPTCPRIHEACVERGDAEESLGLPRLHPKRWGGFSNISRFTRR